MHIFLPLLLSSLLSGALRTPSAKVTLTVDVLNVRPTKGTVHVALYRPCADFPGCQPLELKQIAATGPTVKATFEAEPGAYAVAVYHDQNSNGHMDTRLFGIPKEPYGFSNNFRPRFSAPKFADCRFEMGNGGRAIQIRLN